VLSRPLWLCRLARYVDAHPSAVRYHLQRLIARGRVRVKEFGDMKFYERVPLLGMCRDRRGRLV
jgi:predicted ArsR family transcriptional regulator